MDKLARAVLALVRQQDEQRIAKEPEYQELAQEVEEARREYLRLGGDGPESAEARARWGYLEKLREAFVKQRQRELWRRRLGRKL